MRSIEVVHLTWVDSETIQGWSALDEVDTKLREIHAVGFLIHQDKERFVLSIGYDQVNDHANPILVIPKAAVKKVKVLCAITMK